MNDKSKFIKKITGITGDIDAHTKLGETVVRRLFKEVVESKTELQITGKLFTVQSTGAVKSILELAITSLIDAVETKQESFGNHFLPNEYSRIKARLMSLTTDTFTRKDFKAYFVNKERRLDKGIRLSISMQCNKFSNPVIAVGIYAVNNRLKTNMFLSLLHLAVDVENI